MTFEASCDTLKMKKHANIHTRKKKKTDSNQHIQSNRQPSNE